MFKTEKNGVKAVLLFVIKGSPYWAKNTIFYGKVIFRLLQLSRIVYFNVRRPPYIYTKKVKGCTRIDMRNETRKRKREGKINGYCYNTKQCVPIKINEG